MTKAQVWHQDPRLSTSRRKADSRNSLGALRLVALEGSQPFRPGRRSNLGPGQADLVHPSRLAHVVPLFDVRLYIVADEQKK